MIQWLGLCTSTAESLGSIPDHETAATAAKLLQSCPALSDPMDCNLPGSSIHGIFQARVLEWGAIAFSKSVWLEENQSICSVISEPNQITTPKQCCMEILKSS